MAVKNNGNPEEDRDLSKEYSSGFDAGVVGAENPPTNPTLDQEQIEAVDRGFEDGVAARSNNGGQMPTE